MEYKIKLYKDLIIKNNYKSKDIIFLVCDNKKAFEYKNIINLKYSEELKIITYTTFIKNEIKKYWPIVLDEIKKIDIKNISPVFLNNNLVDFIINQKVSIKRKKLDYFKNITSSDKNISFNISTNIKKSSESLTKKISEKLYSSKEHNTDYETYQNMNEVILEYLNDIIKNGILDESLSIYIYNDILLRNEFYINKIKNEIDYIMVDTIEKTKTCEVEFINFMSSFCKKIYVFSDKGKDYSIFNNIDLKYIKDNLKSENIKYFINNNEVDNIKLENILTEDIYLLNKKVYLDDESQLYNDMIKKCCDKIKELIDNGYSKKDICIITPNNNNIIHNIIKNEIKEIDIFNIRNDKIIDNQYISCMYVSLCILFDLKKYITYDEYINFIEVLFEVNKIKARKILNSYDDKLKDIISYIKSLEKLEVDEFLNKFYIDKMLNLKYGKENISICKKLIDEVEKFISIFEKDYEKYLLKYIKNFVYDFNYNEKDINSVCITTPIHYLNNEMKSKIQIWLDISSDLWISKIDKDISNFVVLRKSFNDIYKSDMEKYYQEYYANNLVYSLLKNTDEVYLYKSEYSINGYIQDSYFSRYIENIIDKFKKE